MRNVTRLFGVACVLAAAGLTAAVADDRKPDAPFSDKEFVIKATSCGMHEVELGKLAIQRGVDPTVKEFGQRMIADHSRANNELKAVAAKKNIELPSDLNSSQKSTMEKLSKLSGAEFDKEYISDMVNDHEEDVEDFQTQANKGNDPEIKAFAAKALPTLQGHLQKARELAKKIGAK